MKIVREIYSCDPSSSIVLEKMRDSVNKTLKRYPSARALWLQSSAGSSSYAHHRLTCVIEEETA